MEDDLIGKVVYFEWDGLVGLAKIISKDNGMSYYCELLGDLRGRGHGIGDSRWHVAKRAMNLVDNSMSLLSRLDTSTNTISTEYMIIDGSRISAETISYATDLREAIRPFTREEGFSTIGLGF